jgi:hypothetical protein
LIRSRQAAPSDRQFLARAVADATHIARIENDAVTRN